MLYRENLATGDELRVFKMYEGGAKVYTMYSLFKNLGGQDLT